MKTTEASLHSKAASSASLCARVAAAVTAAVAAATATAAASAPTPQVRRRRAAWCTKRESHLLLPSLEVRHGTHYMETACGAKCKRVVQRELENTSFEQLLDGEKSQMHACFLVKLTSLV